MTKKYGSFVAIILPILRKSLSSMIASQIVDVQPMTAPTGQIFTMRTRYENPKNFKLLSTDDYDEDVHVPNDYCVVEVSYAVNLWIEEQDISLWKPVDDVYAGWRYVISNEFFTVMALKWS
jgi:hypothetical protein